MDNIYDLLDMDTCYTLNEREYSESPSAIGKGDTLRTELKALGGSNIQEQDHSHRVMSLEDTSYDGSLST